MAVANRELAVLEERIAGKVAARRSLMNELKRLTGRWRDLRAELREVSGRARRDRAEMAEWMAQLRGSSAVRREVLSRIRGMRGKMERVEGVLHTFERSTPRESQQQVAERLARIEWKLQTQRLTRAEEKLLVAYVKTLEAKLLLWKRAYAARQELMSLLHEIRGLKGKLDEMNEARERLEPEIQARRAEVAQLERVRMQLRSEVADVEGDMAELERKLVEGDAELRQLEAARGARLSAVAEARLAVARERVGERVARGQKLSFDELKVWYADSADELLK